MKHDGRIQGWGHGGWGGITGEGGFGHGYGDGYGDGHGWGGDGNGNGNGDSYGNGNGRGSGNDPYFLKEYELRSQDEN